MLGTEDVPLLPARSCLRRGRRNMVLSYWVRASMRRETTTCVPPVALRILPPVSPAPSLPCEGGQKRTTGLHQYNRSGHSILGADGTVTPAQPNILAAKALSLALAAASASLHAVKASRISFDFGSSLLAASRSALAAA